ncbi:hypothetical protein F4823DRAFT_563535 [Ustulina deusta]|nr:hypothetical protein F4823DRAFT_563535 [Ustulina deusta]
MSKTDPTSSTSTTNSASTASTTSSTDFPSFTVPTETLLSAPAETSEAVAIAPVFLYLWSERLLVQDEEHKQYYIKNVKKSRHSTKALFGRFKDQPPAKPECKKKSLNKRSLISGILDAFKGVADLISCAVDVLDNLVDAVDNIHPPIPEIELLTDTLKDLGNEINKRGDEHPTSASSYASSSTPSPSSSSCTTVITKTWESILCTVTETSSANRKLRDEGCTTEVYSTVTGYSVVASTITSTTTITPGPTPNSSQCRFDACGPGLSCSQNKRELERRFPPRLSEPEPDTWCGPKNYGGNNQNFMAGEVRMAYENTEQEYHRGVKLEVGTTSNNVLFSGKPGSLAVSGLYGCTSVIAISRRGAWISHFWEVPSFTHSRDDPSPPTDLQQLETFRQQVLAALHTGDTIDHLYGLAELRVTRDSNMLPTSHLMEDDADPHVFIFAPYKRGDLGTSSWNNEFPVGLPEAWGQDDGLPSKNQQIQNEVRAIFSSPNRLVVPYEKVLYAPREGFEGDDLGDKNFDSNRGKVLVQYQPAKNCQEKASWRVWFEGHELQDSHQSSWTPSANQIAVSHEVALKGRQDTTDSVIACPLPSPTASSTDQGTSSSILTLPTSSTDEGSLPSTVTPLASSTSQGNLSSMVTLLSSIDAGSSSSTATPPASSTDQSTSLSSQSSFTTLSSPPTSEEPSSATLPSSTEAPTELATTTPNLTTEGPTETSTTTSLEPMPTPTTTITPLKAFDIVCNSEADFHGHADVSPSWQGRFAYYVGTFWKPDGGYMSSSSATIDAKFKDNHGISYEYSVSWIPTCVTTVDQQSFQFPLGEKSKVTAEALLKDDYKLCKIITSTSNFLL